MLLRRIDSRLVARVSMSHDGGGWIAPEATLLACRGFVRSVPSRTDRKADFPLEITCGPQKLDPTLIPQFRLKFLGRMNPLTV